jgi:F0F1-type ATP synthase delta subunit
MKYSLKNYGQALAEEVLKKENPSQGDVARNFIDMLKRSGDEAHAGKIIKEAERVLRKEGGVRSVVFESARPLGAAQQKSLAVFSRSGDVVSYRTDPRLIAGVRILVDDEKEFDGSLKGKLDKLLGDQ